MGFFVSIVLLAAALQSLLRIALLPRRWGILLAVSCAALPWLGRSWLGRVSLAAQLDAFTSVGYLQGWCTLLCVQEILTMMTGGSLMGDLLQGRRPRRWKILCLLPSLLLPAGILFVQMLAFNTFLTRSFTQLTAILSAACLVAALLLTEAPRRLFGRDALMLRLFHFEWLLLFLAMFVPMAATVDLAPDSTLLPQGTSTAPILLLAAVVLSSTLFFYLYRTIRLHVHHHTSP